MKKTILSKMLLQSKILYMLIVVFVCTISQMADAQTKNLRFKHLTINDGLSHSWIHSIIQDQYGFTWIGTDDGLDRYDGYDFHVYKNNYQNENSISNSNVMSLFQDSRGELWVGTRQGLNLYERKKEQFIRYSALSKEQVLSIDEDSSHNLWIGTNHNIYCVDLQSDSIRKYPSEENYAVLVDSKENIWIGSSKGLFLYEKEKNSFINCGNDVNDDGSFISGNVRSIIEDKSGRLWIGTTSGLSLFVTAKDQPIKGSFIHFRNKIDDRKSISEGTVLSLLEDDKRNLWIGIENGGLDMLDLNTFNGVDADFIHFKNDSKKPTSLSNNSIYTIFQDKQGSIWIGTYGNGINITNPIADKFIHFMNEPGVENSLSNNQVNVFLEEENYLWIGTEGGLNRYDKNNGTFRHYVHDPFNRNSLGSNAVWALCKDKQGYLWVGTWRGGVNRFDYNTAKFKRYVKNPKDSNSIGCNNIYSIYEDSQGNLWIGTMGDGLNMLDRKRKKFIRYNTTNSDITTNYVQSIIETEGGDLWLANGNSFERFDKKTKKFEHFVHNPDDSTSLSSDKVTTIYEDSRGNLWMGTNAGLNFFNKYTKKFTCFKINDGLPDNFINSVLEDNSGNLWIGTNKGLSKFINAVNIPVEPEFKNYTYEDGLQSNGFSRRSCFKSAEGLMYFGGTNGFNVFDPDKITDNTYIPIIVITSFHVFNKPEFIGDKGYKRDSGDIGDIVLSYKQSVFSFNFAALNYISSSKNQYAYKMEGFDNDWNYVGTRRNVTYTNLDPGKYIFKVKGSNNDGVWNEKGIFLPVVITPPFWKTVWFYGLMMIIAIGTVLGLFKWRVRRLLKREKELNIRIQEALAKNRVLNGLLPICSNCKKIRDDKGYWDQLEKYIQTHSEAQFTHGLCPECAKKLYPDYNFDDL